MITLPIKQMAFDVFFSFLRRTWNFFSEKNIGWVCSHVNLIKISKNQRIRSLKNKRSICFNFELLRLQVIVFHLSVMSPWGFCNLWDVVRSIMLIYKAYIHVYTLVYAKHKSCLIERISYSQEGEVIW